MGASSHHCVAVGGIVAKMNEIEIIVYFNTYFANNMLMQHSLPGIIIFLNSTPVKWICKKQNTVENHLWGQNLWLVG